MAFYGKIYSPFRLVHGDFLEQQFRSDILQSSIVFVNNFAFGPEVDQHLKDIFADLNDGARIFSSKSFCALNFRITDRNLSGKWNFLWKLGMRFMTHEILKYFFCQFSIV